MVANVAGDDHDGAGQEFFDRDNSRHWQTSNSYATVILVPDDEPAAAAHTSPSHSITGSRSGSSLAKLLLFAALAVVPMVAIWAGFFGASDDQEDLALALIPASKAAAAYGVANSGYAGMSNTELVQYGFHPRSDVAVNVFAIFDGAHYCVEAFRASNPDAKVHMPTVVGDSATYLLNSGGEALTYAIGGCPVNPRLPR